MIKFSDNDWANILLKLSRDNLPICQRCNGVLEIEENPIETAPHDFPNYEVTASCRKCGIQDSKEIMKPY